MGGCCLVGGAIRLPCIIHMIVDENGVVHSVGRSSTYFHIRSIALAAAIQGVLLCKAPNSTEAEGIVIVHSVRVEHGS